jgi:GNAT superfamily N-acetyltransferase
MPSTIENLADHPDALPILAQWQHAEWGDLREGDTLEKRTTRLKGVCNRNRIPLTVVAREGTKVFGSASLVLHDMETRMELTPWLAGVFVGEPYRRKGIGAALVRRIVNEASRLDVRRLYLYTVHSERLYSALGWMLYERTRYRDRDVVIMTYDPPRLNP